MALRIVKFLLLPFKVGYHLPRRHQRNNHTEDNTATQRNCREKLSNGNCSCCPPIQCHLLNQWCCCCHGGSHSTRRGQNFYQDGFISSLMVFIIFIAVSFSVTLCYWITPHQSVKVQFHVNQAFLITYMMLACLIMWSLCSYQSKTLNFLQKYIIEKPNYERSVEQSGGGGVSSAIPPSSLSRNSNRTNISSMGFGELIAGKFRKNIQDAIPLVGLFVFFTIGIFMDVVLIIANGTCLKAFTYCNMGLQYSISVAFHVCRILFQATCLAFTFKFHRKAFRQCTLIRYSLLIILAATAANWFDTLLFQSHEIFGEHNPYIEFCDIQHTAELVPNMTAQGYTYTDSMYLMLDSTQETNITQCITLKTSLFEINTKVSVFLYPLHIEYALLVCEIVFHLYFNVEPLAPETPCEIVDGGDLGVVPGSARSPSDRNLLVESWLDNTVEPGPGGHNNTAENIDDISASLSESEPLLINCATRQRYTESTSSRHSHGDGDGQGAIEEDGGDVRVLSGEGGSQENANGGAQSDPRPAAVRRRLKGGVPKLFAFAMLLNTVYITMGGLTFLDNGSEDSPEDELLVKNKSASPDNYAWRYHYEIFKVIFYSIIIVTTAIGYVASCTSKSKFRIYSGLDLLILASTLGLFLQGCLALIAAAAFSNGSVIEGNFPAILESTSAPPEQKDRPIVPYGMTVAVVISRLLAMVEVFLQATFFMHAGRIKIRKTDKVRKLLMKEVLFLLAVSNLAIWFVDSFIEVKNQQVSPVSIYYYGHKHWELIVLGLTPFILFYRFNSFLILVSNYFDH